MWGDRLAGRGETGEVSRDLSDWSDRARADVYGHVFLDGDGEFLSFTHRHRAEGKKADRKY